jgi:hypothetical protein
VEPERELGVCGALLAEEGEEGAVAVSSLRGSASALGRWQPGALAPWQPGALAPGQPGAPGALRRWTGGRATRFGDGIIALSAVAPGPQSWLDERERLPGPRLLNRWARGLLAGLGAMGLQAAYPGRDFASANGRQVAALGIERTRAGRFLFHALIGADRPHPGEPDPEFPGLPRHPPASSVAAEGGDPTALRALARGFAQRLGLELIEAGPPAPGAVPPEPTPIGVVGSPVPIPIGQLRAALQLGADGGIARAQLLGDWIAASDDVAMLENALVGADPQDAARIEAIAERWLALPGLIAIGLTDARALVAALRSAAMYSGPSGA